MRLDDFNVDVVAEHPRRHVQKFQAEIHADAHVRRHHHADLCSGGIDPLFLLRGESGGTDDDTPAVTAADLQMLQRRRRRGEIDQHVEALRRRLQVVDNRHAEFADTGDHAGIAAEQLMAGTLAGHGQLHAVGAPAGVDEGTAHAAGGSGDCYTRHSGLPPD